MSTVIHCVNLYRDYVQYLVDLPVLDSLDYRSCQWTTEEFSTSFRTNEPHLKNNYMTEAWFKGGSF